MALRRALTMQQHHHQTQQQQTGVAGAAGAAEACEICLQHIVGKLEVAVFDPCYQHRFHYECVKLLEAHALARGAGAVLRCPSCRQRARYILQVDPLHPLQTIARQPFRKWHPRMSPVPPPPPAPDALRRSLEERRGREAGYLTAPFKGARAADRAGAGEGEGAGEGAGAGAGAGEGAGGPSGPPREGRARFWTKLRAFLPMIR